MQALACANVITSALDPETLGSLHSLCRQRMAYLKAVAALYLAISTRPLIKVILLH